MEHLYVVRIKRNIKHKEDFTMWYAMDSDIEGKNREGLFKKIIQLAPQCLETGLDHYDFKDQLTEALKGGKCFKFRYIGSGYNIEDRLEGSSDIWTPDKLMVPECISSVVFKGESSMSGRYAEITYNPEDIIKANLNENRKYYQFLLPLSFKKEKQEVRTNP